MALYDFGQEEKQQERNYGPVPSGSRVLVRMTVQTPSYPSHADPALSATKAGMLQLPTKVEVIAGTYAGVTWFENINLPSALQSVQLTDNQRTACKIGGSLMRGILESARGIDPDATDPRSAAARLPNAWTDFNDLTFPAKVGINRRSYIGKDGREYWNNSLVKAIPATDPEYARIKQGGEIITDGPTTGQSDGNGNAGNASSNRQESERMPWDDMPHPASSAYDDVNF